MTGFDPDRLDNAAQLDFGAELGTVVQSHGELATALKKKHNTITAIYKQAGKLLRVKQDKRWSELGLIGADSALDERFIRVCFADEVQGIRGALDWPRYWFECMNWLQSSFPDGKYADVVGLCKAAEREEYTEEQDYSLNAGRYVGVVIEGDDMTEDEFSDNLSKLKHNFTKLSEESIQLEQSITKNLEKFLLEKFI